MPCFIPDITNLKEFIKTIDEAVTIVAAATSGSSAPFFPTPAKIKVAAIFTSKFIQ